VSNPTPLLARDLKQDLFAGLEEIADLIVIDTPPLTAVASASILSKYVDGVIVVIRAGHTKRNLAQRAVKSLRQIHAPLLGVIVYDTPLKQSIYGSSYGYQPDLEEVRSSNPHGNPFRMRGSRTGRSATLHGTNGNPQRHGAVSRAE
jgi:Mrp family chromosome partitioning ATPase